MTLRDRLLEYSDRNHPTYKEEGYTLEFWVCKICGFFEWVSATGKGQGFKVQVDPFTHRECMKCREVALRAPEIFRWVLNVMEHHSEEKNP